MSITKLCICCQNEKPTDFFSRIKKVNGGTKRDGICNRCKSNKFGFGNKWGDLELDSSISNELATKLTKGSKKLGNLITKEDYNLMYHLQDGKCKICSRHQSKLKKSLSIDHCHKTGKIRGLLCHNCNAAIGLLKEDINAIESAIIYLKLSRTEN